MVKCGVLFEIRPEFLNNIQTSVGFKGLIRCPTSFIRRLINDIYKDRLIISAVKLCITLFTVFTTRLLLLLLPLPPSLLPPPPLLLPLFPVLQLLLLLNANACDCVYVRLIFYICLELKLIWNVNNIAHFDFFTTPQETNVKLFLLIQLVR
jgi:hypothetical protein